MTLHQFHVRQDLSYPPARGPVLLITCMDLRLLDEVTRFMDHDGLTNRYDQLIFAGAALGALGAPGYCQEKHQGWHCTFLEHLEIAYELRKFKDVYILEHRDCGAYEKFLGGAGTFNDEQAKDEEDCHRRYANDLRKVIVDWAHDREIQKLTVKSFLMDLRGDVLYLDEDAKKQRKTKKKKKPPKE